jgi:hypothetical protein
MLVSSLAAGRLRVICRYVRPILFIFNDLHGRSPGLIIGKIVIAQGDTVTAGFQIIMADFLLQPDPFVILVHPQRDAG